MGIVRALCLLVALSAGAPGWAATLKGVSVPDAVRVEGKSLTLNGLGLRKKFGFSVYVGALYLTTPTRDAKTALKAEEPKRLSLHFLRDVSASSLKEAFEEGFFKNSQERLSALRGRIDALFAYLPEGGREGEEVTFTYLPGVGTRVAAAGRERGTLPGRDFMEALWAVWLGDLPASRDLKAAMLGQP